MTAAIRVLVVDDSAFMRQAISKMLESDPDIRVVATARSGEEGIAKIAQSKPDVVTMDVEMPGMGGLQAVRTIVAEQRVPIIMVSALTREGAETTFRALEFGAVDFIAKPDAAYANIKEVARDLVVKVRTFAGRGTRPMAIAETPERSAVREPVSHLKTFTTRANFGCVAIGSSTGGPVALARIVPRLPKHFPPTLIVQHMPVGFTRPLAERLNAQSTLHVVEASDGTILESGTALVIPSGHQIRLNRVGTEVELRLIRDDGTSLHVPSVDVLTHEVAERYGALGLGVILTGMGQDGVKGLSRLKERGGYVVGQDEATCIVYGMPRAAAQAGLVDRVAPLGDIARVLTELTSQACLPNS
jgi:two-component system, chemotaxis family, protein-glutamate methylesterase/glutaminase